MDMVLPAKEATVKVAPDKEALAREVAKEATVKAMIAAKGATVKAAPARTKAHLP
jgi:hypothetical protein